MGNSMDKNLVDALVVDLMGGDVVKVTDAAKSIVDLAEDKNNQKKLFQFKGIVSGLLEVVGKEGEEYKVGREYALKAIQNIACGGADVKKGMFGFDEYGLMKSLLEVVGKEGEEYKVGRENALGAIFNISCADVEKGMFELDGLMKSLLEVVGKEGEEYKVGREYALESIQNISCGGADVKKGMFELDGLMKSLLEVVGKEGEEYKDAREKALAAIWSIANGGADVQKGMLELDGLMKSLLEVVGKEGEEYKVAREYALQAVVNIADGAEVQFGLATFPSLLPTLLQYATKDSPSPECRKQSVWALAKIAGNLSTAPLLLTPKDSTVDILACVMEIMKEAGEDLKKWEGGNSIESWSLTFLMNVAQAEFAVPYLRVAGVAKVLAPLVKQKHYESLKAASTVAYLVGGDEEGELFDLLSDNKHAIDRIVDLLDNTLNLKGDNIGYLYGVFPLHSSVRAIKILSKSDNFKDYLLSKKNCFALLHRTLSQFITDTNAGRAGGGAADVESAALAVEALHELSYPSPTSSTSALDIVTKKVDSNFGSLADLLSAYKDRSSVKSSKEYASSTFTATVLIDRISLLANKSKVKEAVAAMKKRKSNSSSAPESSADAAANAAELVKALEALERNLANEKENSRLLEEKTRLLEEKIAQTANEKDALIVELKRQAEAEAAKHELREDSAQAQLNELRALAKENKQMMEQLHTKTDVIMTDGKDVKKTVKETLSSLQNFFTNESPVPRFILIVPPANSDKISYDSLLKSTTASLNVLCAHDLSIACTFQIKEPRKWVKDYAPALKNSLKALQLVAAATKMATGLPFSIPDTSSFDEFLDEANGAISEVFEESESAGDDDRAALRKIESGDGDEKTRKITGASYAKLKRFFEDEGRMKELRRTMDKVRGKDGKEEWVSRKNLDEFCAENDAAKCEGEDDAEVEETVAETKKTAAHPSDVHASSASLPSSSTTLSSESTHEVVHEAYLEKQGRGLGKWWKKRYFKLTKKDTTTYLKYYDKVGSEKCKGAIILAGTTAKVVGATEFDLRNEDTDITTLHLRADTKLKMDMWLDKLKEVGVEVEL
ncbi:hypothetical protein TrCOL_g12851 [Triparma columacea]|uniref:PH domain-containing protein n=1 Tax=Triparma columacea TaxID=722753 RepID=A0A9W7GE29_9STRA|nr:hypothetical protein TrCOL_g12851 [Triparma columacea]